MSYKKLTGFICFLLITQIGFSQVFEETKTYTQSYKASLSTQVDISNKYGSVLISTWDKDSVMIKVNLKIIEKNEARFKKIKDNINVEFSGMSNNIFAHTVFGSKYSSIVKDVAEATNYLSANDNQSKIEYRVFAPEYININIDNKYGDVVIPSLKGNVKVTLSNGNFQCRDIDGQADLNLSFGNADINNLRQANINLNFVQCNIASAGSITLDGKSSGINIESIETLRVNSRRDKLNVSKASSIYGESYFSKLMFNEIMNECQLQMSYGNISTLMMGPAFKKLELNSLSCNLNITLKQPEAYNALIKAKNCSLSIPSDLKCTISDYMSKIEETPISFYYKLKQSYSKVKINISGADLKITHQ